MAKVVVLGNPNAGGGASDVHRVVAAVAATGVEVDLLEAPSADTASAALAGALASGPDRVVAVGGDGLVRIAADAMAGTGVTLGIVPQGTGNDFARALGLLEGDLRSQVRAALSEPVAVDAMRTDHGWVASVATFGFSADVTARANALSWPRGQQRYTLATLLQLPRLRRVPVTVSVDGVAHAVVASLVAIGNTAYFGGGMKVCPGARPADGRLEVVVIGDVSRRTFARVFPLVFSGRHVRHPAVEVFGGRVVELTGAAEMVWADGDPLGGIPVRCEAVAGALSVAGARLSVGEDDERGGDRR